jgi:hypothetical protein
MNLNHQELAKVRKVALHSVTISNEMKASVVEAKLKELTTEIKKIILKKNIIVEVLIISLSI